MFCAFMTLRVDKVLSYATGQIVSTSHILGTQTLILNAMLFYRIEILLLV
jgi:hypothetical protein